MNIDTTPIAGLLVVRGTPVTDHRGSLERLYCAEGFALIAPGMRCVQVNLTHTHQRGTVRGLHYQTEPAAEYKLIRCLRGQAFDVTVDLRPDSPTWGHWHAVHLTADAPISVLIPPGCAHGVQALSDSMTLLYQHSAPYQADCAAGIAPHDPDLAIAWPLPMAQLSQRDQTLPSLASLRRPSSDLHRSAP